MLIRRGLMSAVAGLLLALTIAAPAEAAGPGDGGVVCPPTVDYCLVQAKHPGSPATRAHKKTVAGGKRVCRNQFTGEVVDCYDSMFGWFNPTNACYYKLVEPQPPATDPAWERHYPNGAIYHIVCPGIIGTGGGWGWVATPPPGFGPRVSAAQLAQEAIRRLRLLPPEIGMAPPPTSTGLVGVPVWLWTDVTPATWGPTSATASVPGLSVTATARADHIVWDMGDAHSVTCANPGTHYRQSFGGGPSPTCGYQYSMSSAQQPGAKYTVTATTTWNVTWAGGGQSGQLTVARSSSTRLGVGELQVLVS